VRRISPPNKASAGHQADSPPDRLARPLGRSVLPAAGRLSPADGPHRPPPSETKTPCVPEALPPCSSSCPCWSPRPWEASRLAPALPPVAAPRAAPSRLQASAVMDTASAVGEEVAVTAVKAKQLGLVCEANRSNCGQETSTTATQRVRGRGDPDRSGPDLYRAMRGYPRMGSGDRKIKRS
jgi:hypothetical protein